MTNLKNEIWAYMKFNFLWSSKRPRINFNSYLYNPQTGELIINFEASKNLKPLFTSNLIRIKYLSIKPVTVTETEAADIFCAFTLPHIAAQKIAVDVNGILLQSQFEFWNEYCAKLLGGSSLEEPNFICKSCGLQKFKCPDPPAKPPKIGLLFGGGVESLTALSEYLEKEPLLLSLTGPFWMNNDHAASKLKYDLENRLTDEFVLEIARVWHNFKEVVITSDEYMNKYITGGLMYYLFMPVVREKNCNAIYHSMENEYVTVNEQYDRSIHPSFSHKISRKNLPPLQTTMTEYTKIELFDKLYKNSPRLFSYLYSCLNNTNLRWCGTCGKCRRLSAFCEAAEIDKSIIGMQQGISFEPETGVLTKLYWQNLEIYKTKKRLRL